MTAKSALMITSESRKKPLNKRKPIISRQNILEHLVHQKPVYCKTHMQTNLPMKDLEMEFTTVTAKEQCQLMTPTDLNMNLWVFNPL